MKNWRFGLLALFTPLLMAMVQADSSGSADGEAEQIFRQAATADFTEPPLPDFPLPPKFDNSRYPDCREDFQQMDGAREKAQGTTSCLVRIDRYYTSVIRPFSGEMIDHQIAVTRLYTEDVAKNNAYSVGTRESFYDAVQSERAAANPDGPYQADYRDALAQYQQDRTYLLDRFCFNTGCGGYADVAESKAARKQKKKKEKAMASSGPKCREARKKGGGIGAFLGGLVGEAAGFGTVGKLLTAGLTGVLAAEIACKLTEDEQVAAAEATVEVTKTPEVGKTVQWVSPERAGVEGSSTITKVASRPSGATCLDITDVVIVDGEETTISKKMCRKPGEQRYAIA